MEEGRGGKQDFHFVRAVWRFLCGAEQLEYEYKTSSPHIDPRGLLQGKKIVLLSDGASAHFKQKKTVCFWVELQLELGIVILIHFFASYHGHNVCDAHAQHVKMAILYWIRKHGVNPTGFEEMTKAVSRIKNTHVFLLPEGAIKREKVPVLARMLDKQLAGIKSFHHFRLNGQNLECFKFSIDEKPAKVIEIPTSNQILEEQINTLGERIALLRSQINAVQQAGQNLEQSFQEPQEQLQEEPQGPQGIQEEEDDSKDAEDGENLSTETSEEHPQDQYDVEEEEEGTFCMRRLNLESLPIDGDSFELEDINNPQQQNKFSHLLRDHFYYY